MPLLMKHLSTCNSTYFTNSPNSNVKSEIGKIRLRKILQSTSKNVTIINKVSSRGTSKCQNCLEL